MFLLVLDFLLLSLLGLSLLSAPSSNASSATEQVTSSPARPAFLDRYFSQLARDLSLDESDFWKTLARVFY